MRSGAPHATVVIGVIALVALALVHRGEIQARASDALGRGMPPREAELARGFVLGDDEDVDAATVEDFRRSGLAHLLAVSGQNVALLGLLAMPLLALLGMPLRTRLVWIIGAIVVYVPLAGAEPSIVRAAVMGGLSLLAILAGRRASRVYALAIAALVTLAIDPGLGRDVGWQLSFAAVIGILAFARPLRGAIVARTGSRGVRGALAEGAALTIAATLATAPLIAFHFEAFSTTALLANLLVLPAVAPAMWLGMLVAIAGQIPGFPVEALGAVNAPLLAYVAQVAAWCGRPSWAYIDVELGPTGLVFAYAGLVLGAVAVPALLRRWRIARLRRGRTGSSFTAHMPVRGARLGMSRVRGVWVGIVVAVLCVAVFVFGTANRHASAPAALRSLRVSVLDVGQGDAILLQPAAAPALLVDAGPADGELVEKLRAAGVERLGAVVVTHEQADHTGGVAELLGELPVERLLYARLGRILRNEASRVGVEVVRIAAGAKMRSGRLRLEALWPPPALLTGPLAGADPNSQALVLLARWHRFSVLLTGDAEVEAVPLDPGPVDVLKVAHHGSDDAGLAALIERTSPRLAVISVGEGNPFGHPTARTLATLAAHDVATLRTDTDGAITIDVTRDSALVTRAR
jgi:competence protein ComEC